MSHPFTDRMIREIAMMAGSRPFMVLCGWLEGGELTYRYAGNARPANDAARRGSWAFVVRKSQITAIAPRKDADR